MIYVTIGTLDYPFGRLMKGIDQLSGDLKSQMLAQIGGNTPPEGVRTIPFCSRTESMIYIKEAELVLTHGGSTVMEALIEGKRIVAVPRMKRHGEALNDHQVDLCVKLSERGLLTTVLDVDDLGRAIKQALGTSPPKLSPGRLPLEVTNILDDMCKGTSK